MNYFKYVNTLKFLNIEHNISRIKYLIKLYQLSDEDFFIKISEGLKNPLTEKDVFGSQIKLTNLKRIDKLIVLKRQQKAFRREIFTLSHELGHYLINEEEIEEVDVSTMNSTNLTRIENWCNNFAYYFLIGGYKNKIDNIQDANALNDYYFDLIEKISKGTHLSTLAIFTRLLYYKKISIQDYKKVKSDLYFRYQEKIEKEERKKELDKLMGVKRRGSVSKPINSPLFVNILQSALYGGIINEYDFCKKLNIKPEKLQQYI